MRILQRRGDANLHYRDGLELLGEAEAGWLSADALHLSPEGYDHMGHRYYELEFARGGRLAAPAAAARAAKL